MVESSVSAYWRGTGRVGAERGRLRRSGEAMGECSRGRVAGRAGAAALHCWGSAGEASTPDSYFLRP